MGVSIFHSMQQQICYCFEINVFLLLYLAMVLPFVFHIIYTYILVYQFFALLFASALHSFGRAGGSYDDRRFIDKRFPRDNIYARNAFHRDTLERDNYPPQPAVGVWPQTRRSYEEEYSIDRESRRHEKPYVDSYQDMDTFHESDKYNEVDTFHEYDKLRDGYRSIDTFRDHGFDRSARYGGRDHEDYALDDYDYRPRISRQSREDSREREYEYGRHSYDSDYDRGSRRDSKWRRHESRDRERSGLSRERDPSPYRRHDRSRSRGHDDRLRSRSPRGRSRARSHREDSYDDARHERSEKRRDFDEKRQHDHFAVVCFFFQFSCYQ